MLIKRIVVLFLVMISIFLLICFAEKILCFKNEKILRGGISLNGSGKRYIVLRENEPLLSMTIEPSTRPGKDTDSLVQKKYKFRVDGNGFIIPSKIYDRPDMSIVFLGGSTTECVFVDEENRFPYLVGRMIEKETGKKINSYNSGVSGNNSLHSLDILLNKIIPMKPDIVIMEHNINDLTTQLLCNTYWDPHPTRGLIVTVTPTWQGLVKHKAKHFFPNLFILIRNIKDRSVNGQLDEFKNVRGTRIDIDKYRIQNEFRMNLQTFINICNVRKITPILMTQHSRLKEHAEGVIYNAANILKSDYGIEYSDYKEIFDLLNEMIRKVGEENNVLVIDLAKEVPQEKEYIYDLVHLNDVGSKLVAQIISRELKEMVNNARRE